MTHWGDDAVYMVGDNGRIQGNQGNDALAMECTGGAECVIYGDRQCRDQRF